MFRDTYQCGLFTIFNSSGLDPLKNWDVHCRGGFVKRVYERENGMLVTEMRALNTTVHYITCPKCPHRSLGIRMPIINLLIRSLSATFSFEVRVIDINCFPRRFTCANFASRSAVSTFVTMVPLTLNQDWVLIYFNMAEFMRQCYSCEYFETERVQINGNVQIRRIFFSDSVIEYNKLPLEYKLSTLVREQWKSRTPCARPSTPINTKRICVKVSRKRRQNEEAEPSINNSTGTSSPGKLARLSAPTDCSHEFETTGDSDTEINEITTELSSAEV